MKRAGFTLIELSIVLVIIGLIVGSVLVGRDLIEASKIRSTISQLESFKTAVNTFKLKYNGLPGDIVNPTQFGLSNPTSSTWVVKGNGFMESSNGASEASYIVPGFETTHFWYHLSQTGLIPNTLLQPPINQLAQNASPKTADVVAQYIPQPPIGGTTAFWYIYLSGDQQYYTIAGTPEVGYTYGTTTNVLTPGQVRAIDQKIDDGLPLSGKVQPTRAYLTQIHIVSNQVACRTSATVYATNDDPNCNIRFNFQ